MMGRGEIYTVSVKFKLNVLVLLTLAQASLAQPKS
jgi:hypothetical protein